MILKLTHDLVHKAWNHIEEIEKLGGMAKAIDTGIPKMRIEQAAAKKSSITNPKVLINVIPCRFLSTIVLFITGTSTEYLSKTEEF